MAITIKLTEQSSGKQYKMQIPKFKHNGLTSSTIYSTRMTFTDRLNNILTNLPLQFDMYDDENPTITNKTYYYTTTSGKKLFVKYESFSNSTVQFTLGVVINNNNVNVFTKKSENFHGHFQGIRIDKISLVRQMAGIGLAYCEDDKNFYLIQGNTGGKPLGTQEAPDGTQIAAFQLFSDSQTSPPYLNPQQQDVKGCFYNTDTKLQVSALRVNYFKQWFDNTDPNDWSDPKYPDDDDDPEKPDDDPTDPTPSEGDTSSDPIPIPPKPTTDVTNTGFVTLYNPTTLEIGQLAYFMWSGDFADILKKIFRAPFDCIIGLKLLYAPVITQSAQTIWLGNVETTVSASKIKEQFVDFDCGTININEYFKSFLDYTPFTKITIFLPFIGYKQLNVDEVMNSSLHLVYRIDVYSGSCIAFLRITKNIKSTNLNSVLYSFDGNCAMDIPFTSGDMSRYVAAILGTAASTAGAVISNPVLSEMPLNSNNDATKNPNEKHLSDLQNGTSNLMASKPQIQRGGSLTGANSSMGMKRPYIIIERPLQQMPGDYANFIGIPLNMTKTLSQVTGFTVVSQIFMASTQATDKEIKMITKLLMQGVIL